LGFWDCIGDFFSARAIRNEKRFLREKIGHSKKEKLHARGKGPWKHQTWGKKKKLLLETVNLGPVGEENIKTSMCLKND